MLKKFSWYEGNVIALSQTRHEEIGMNPEVRRKLSLRKKKSSKHVLKPFLCDTPLDKDRTLVIRSPNQFMDVVSREVR